MMRLKLDLQFLVSVIEKQQYWKTDFTLVPSSVGDGVPTAICNHCGWSQKAPASAGTNNFRKHLSNKCKNVPIRDPTQTCITAQGTLGNRKIDQEIFKEKLANLTLYHEYSFSFVEHKKFRELLTYLNPEVNHITRNTLKAKVLSVNDREKHKVEATLRNLPGRISLTSDMWTSNASQSYICLTAHFIDRDWVLRYYVLNFHHFPPSHIGAAMHDCLYSLLKDWGIESKLFSMTLDNASSNTNMQELLCETLNSEHSLPCNGEYFHVRCGAHILNLIVQEGMKIIDGACVRLRKAVNWIDASEGRKIAFTEIAKRSGCDFAKGLSRDSLTRWNSTFDMLERALMYKEAFIRLGEEDRNFIYKLTEVEWYRVEHIYELFLPFSKITTIFSGRKYPTANLYFGKVWEIEMCLRQEMGSADECIRGMATSMKEKFDKYWDNYSMVLSFAAILDPTLKLSYVRFCYKELYPQDYLVKVDEVVKAMEKLFKEYDVDGVEQQGPTESPIVTRSTARDAAFDSFEASELSSCETSFDIYMKEKRLVRREEIDVLAWWRVNEQRLPCMAKMARDILAIPITTVASECTFSLGGRILTKFRQSTLPENAEAIVQTRSWLS